jgi:pantothenate kinase-related protein Tda10
MAGAKGRLQFRRRLLRQDDQAVARRGRAGNLCHDQRFGTVLENVVLDEATRVPDFDDGSLTENTRCAYPIDFIPMPARPARRASRRTSSC